MTVGNKGFGRRVIGDAEYDKAVREEQGGASVFGVRVRGAIPDTGPTNIAKRNTEHGVRVVNDVTPGNTRGEATDGGTVSIDDLRDILAENPTFFDSLYEAELARDGGARDDALRIFQEVERGIKGQGRADVLDEIAALLGRHRELAGQRADLDKVHREQIGRMLRRQEENNRLADADAIQADVDAQMKTIADEKGLDISSGPGEPGGKTPTKPNRHVAVESSGTGPRQGVPKGVGGEEGNGGNGENGAETDYESMTKAELEDEADALGVDLGEIEGSGAGGTVLKEDVLKAVKKAAKKQAKK